MSEQHGDIERRVREALFAEGSEATAPPDLWTRVQPRLERPATPPAGWQRRWSLVAMGAVVAIVLAVGGAGAALIATGLSSGSEGEAFLAFSGTDESVHNMAWTALDAEPSLDGRTARLDGPDGGSFAADPQTFEEPVQATTAIVTPAAIPAPASAGKAGPSGRQLLDVVLETSRPTSGNPQGLAGERQIISQASLDLEVSDVNAAAVQLRGLVESFGGFVEHISTSGGPNPEYGSAVVRVPGDRFLDALDGIERLGKPLGQTLGQRDVTGEVIDLEARLKSERSAEQSLLKLLDRAVSVSDVLTVERELTRVRADFERLQGQLDFIQRSVALATIAVSFVLPPGFIPVAPSASLQLEVDDVERSASRIRDLVSGAGGTMGRVIIATGQYSQEAYLSFLLPASALDGALTSLVGDGVVLHREVQSDGLLPHDERNAMTCRRGSLYNSRPPRALDWWGPTGAPGGGCERSSSSASPARWRSCSERGGAGRKGAVTDRCIAAALCRSHRRQALSVRPRAPLAPAHS